MLPKTKLYYSAWSLRNRNKTQNEKMNPLPGADESNKYDTIRSNAIERNNTETSFISNHTSGKECDRTNSRDQPNTDKGTQSIVYDYIISHPIPKFSENKEKYAN